MAIKSLARSTVRQSQRNNSALAGYESNYFHHLETVRLGGEATTVEFTNLARYSDFQHLQLRLVVRGSAAFNLLARANGDTGTNYNNHYLEANGSTIVSGAATNAPALNFGVAVAESNIFSGLIIDLLDPFDTSKFLTGRSFYGASTAGTKWMGVFSSCWRNTASLDSLTLSGSTMQAGSRFSLYGLKARA